MLVTVRIVTHFIISYLYMKKYDFTDFFVQKTANKIEKQSEKKFIN